MRDRGAGRSNRVWRLALAMSLALGVLGAWNWVLRPDEPVRWLRGILFVPAMWVVMTLYRYLFVRPTRTRDQADEAAIRRYFEAVMLIVLAEGCLTLVTYALGIWAAVFGPIDPDASRRIVGFTGGAMFVVVGNMVPKILTPLCLLPPGRAGRQQEARRFFGLVAVILGLTMAAVAIFAPIDLLPVAWRSALVAGGLAVLAAIVWMNAAPSQPEEQA